VGEDGQNYGILMGDLEGEVKEEEMEVREGAPNGSGGRQHKGFPSISDSGALGEKMEDIF
jgi:hypothetical protein